MIVVLVGLLCGAWTAYTFERWTDQAALDTARDRIIAHWLEIRLYFDNPRLVWRAQRKLVRWHLALLRSSAVWLLASGLLTAGACALLDQHYGQPELRPGETAVLTTHQPVPDGFLVEAGPLQSEADRTTSYRVTVKRPIRHADLELPRDRNWFWPFGLALSLSFLTLQVRGRVSPYPKQQEKRRSRSRAFFEPGSSRLKS